MMHQLEHLEKLIAGSQGSFHEIGRALKEIRDQGLYKKALFETFAAYTKTRWDMGKSQAYRLINSYMVVENLKKSPIGDILPANEFQVRPLIQLSALKQRKVWQDFINSGMEITACNIKKFIEPDKIKTAIKKLGNHINITSMEADDRRKTKKLVGDLKKSPNPKLELLVIFHAID